MAEITIKDKKYTLNYSIWSILKAEEESTIPAGQWGDGSIKSTVALVYAGIADAVTSFEELQKLLPVNQAEFRAIAETCAKELASSLGVNDEKEAK